MGYVVGVDLGTTFSGAAVSRNGRAEMVNVGSSGAVAASVILLRDDGEQMAGDVAALRAESEPARAAREFKRRFGDPAPVSLAGTALSAVDLTTRLLRWILVQVAEREGGQPDMVALTHPANWGPFKRELFDQVVVATDAPRTVTLTEPEAAAIHYATVDRIDPGQVVAVYDLGGGTFDASVLCRTSDGFEILAEPHGVERLGGIDIDHAIVLWTLDQVGLDPNDLAGVDLLRPAQALRDACVKAKIALSSDVDAVIPVNLPGVQADVRLTRGELEQMVSPMLDSSLHALDRSIASAGLTAEQIDRVLLVGGSSRIPLVGARVSAHLRRPCSVDADPKHTVALGAATAAELAMVAPAAVDPQAEGARHDKVDATPKPPQEPDPVPVDPPRPDSSEPPMGPITSAGTAQELRRGRVFAGLGVVAFVALLVAGGVFLATGRDSGNGDDPATAVDDSAEQTASDTSDGGDADGGDEPADANESPNDGTATSDDAADRDTVEAGPACGEGGVETPLPSLVGEDGGVSDTPVGFIHSGRGDGGFIDAAAAGVDAAAADFGITVSEQVSPSGDDPSAAVTAAVDSGADPILFVGFLLADAAAQAASSQPERDFVVLDSIGNGENLSGVVFAEHEGSFLVGAAAALCSRTGTIGFVGGVDIPAVTRFEAGFVAGAKTIKPDIRVEVSYISQSPDFSGFADPDRARDIADAQLDGGADVVFAVGGASDIGVFEAVAERGNSGELVWAIGVDTDQAAPDSPTVRDGLKPFILTSMVKRLDVAAYGVIAAHLGGQLESGATQELGLAADGVAYTTTGGHLSQETVATLETLKDQIISGEIQVPESP